MNKKISFPIAITIIVACAVLVGGIVVWQYYGMPKEEVKPTEEIKGDEKALAENMITEFMNVRMVRDTKQAKSYLTEKGQDSYSEIGFIDFALVGISNPHYSHFEILEINKLDSTRFIFVVRIYEAYTEEKVVFYQYFDEELTVIKSDNKYLVDSVKRGEYGIVQDETADWETYRNEKYGIEIKYPKDWEECELSEIELSFLKIIPPISPSDPPEGMSIVTFKGYCCLFGGVRFRKLEEKYDTLNDLKNYYWNLYENMEGIVCDPELMIKEITFNEQPALERRYCDVSGIYSATIISLIHNQEVFELEFSASAVRRAGEELIYQIFSTFKFID